MKKPAHPKDRFKSRTKESDEKSKQLFDINRVTEILYINIDVSLNLTEREERQNVIIDQIKKIYQMIGRSYIEHNKNFNTFKTKENLDQQEKDKIYKSILAKKKKVKNQKV